MSTARVCAVRACGHRRRARGAALAAAAGGACGYTVGKRTADAAQDVTSASRRPANAMAFVRGGAVRQGRCQTLWLGEPRTDATEVASLGGRERCEAIAWSQDGYRMGFLVNGYELRVFDAEPRSAGRRR